MQKNTKKAKSIAGRGGGGNNCKKTERKRNQLPGEVGGRKQLQKNRKKAKSIAGRGGGEETTAKKWKKAKPAARGIIVHKSRAK